MGLLRAELDEDITFQQQMNDLEVSSKRQLAEVERTKFRKTVEAVGKETLVDLARAGPETQAKILKSLGLKGFMVTNGKTGVNLFDIANQLGGGQQQKE